MQSLRPEERPIFQLQYDDQKKSVLSGVLLSLFLGEFGVAWFYLGNQGKGVLYLLVFLISFPLMLVGIGFLIFALVVLATILDACLMGGTVQKTNREIGRQIFNEIVGTRPEYRTPPPDNLPPPPPALPG